MAFIYKMEVVVDTAWCWFICVVIIFLFVYLFIRSKVFESPKNYDAEVNPLTFSLIDKNDNKIE
jgi:hypothetical protein